MPPHHHGPRHGRWPDRPGAPARITLAWLGEQNVTSGNRGNDNTRSDYCRGLARHIYPFFRQESAGDVDVAMIMTRPLPTIDAGYQNLTHARTERVLRSNCRVWHAAPIDTSALYLAASGYDPRKVWGWVPDTRKGGPCARSIANLSRADHDDDHHK